MQNVTALSPADKTALMTRLKTIEGQARGIAHMLENERDCQAIMDQLLALRAATQSVALEALTTFGTHCLQPENVEQTQALTQMFAMITRLVR
jgi:CsoR family transcriptional regulator, copper-sensing transcriptional repressor